MENVMRYTEHNKHETTNRVMLLLKILGLLILLLCLIAIANIVYNAYQINLTVPLFIIFIIIGVIVYRKMVVEYSYILDAKTLIVQQVAGRHIKQVFVAELSKETRIQELNSDGIRNIYGAKRLYVGKASSLYSVITTKKGKKTTVILKLSPYFVDKAMKTCG